MAARKSLEGEWGHNAPVERGRILHRLSVLILENTESLAVLEAKDTGKPMTQARADIIACARYFEFYGGAADKIHGETIPYLDGYFVSVIRKLMELQGISFRGITLHKCMVEPWHLRWRPVMQQF